MTQKAHDKMSEIDEHIMKRFDIRKRLGKGAYGIVWKAIDRKTGETVAVKKIFDAFRNQTDSQRTFREIMFLQSFRNHPNIIQLHSIHRAANNRDIYLGFEYMDTDLHVVIKRGNILKDCHRRYIMYQLLNATRYIHSGNVIHRDQKPSNVLLDQHCRCKIADFGLARSLAPHPDLPPPGSGEDADDPQLTDYVATRWYRAPEILIASKRYTKGIDMWSLGCILGEMLAGKPIFPGSSTVNQVEKIMATIPTPTSEDIATVCSGIGSSMIKNSTNGCCRSFATILGEDCPEDALDLINKLLIFNPNKRLTAEQALEHSYVAPYRNKNLEISLNRNVVPPLNDDIRLSVNDYRNKLYELMSHHNICSYKKKPIIKNCVQPRKPEIIKVRSCPMPVKDVICEKHIKPISQNQTKDKTFSVHSETKFRYVPDGKQKLSSLSVKSESRIPTAVTRSNIIFQNTMHVPRNLQQQQQRNSIGDFRAVEVRHSPLDVLSKEKPKKKVVTMKNNVMYSAQFNSYSHNHGIITASALRELKSGVR